MTIAAPGALGAVWRPSADLIREHVRRLRQVLAGSRYRIENYRGLGYELIVEEARGAPATGLSGEMT
jgi:hypothetical protein